MSNNSGISAQNNSSGIPQSQAAQQNISSQGNAAIPAYQWTSKNGNIFIPSGSDISAQQIGGLGGLIGSQSQGYWGQTPQYQYTYQTQIQGLTEAIIGYALYENGLPKEKHEAFIGKHHVKILECYHKDNYTTTLTSLKELVKQLKFDGEMSSLLDD